MKSRFCILNQNPRTLATGRGVLSTVTSVTRVNPWTRISSLYLSLWYKPCILAVGTRAPSQYPKRCLIVRSREISKPRDLYLKLSDRSNIWQALRQHCCRCACQISKRYDNLKYQSRGFETSRSYDKTSFLILRRGTERVVGTDVNNWHILCVLTLMSGTHRLY